MNSVSLPRLTIAYEDDGPPGGIPIIFLHGFPDAPQTWDESVAVLHRAGNYRLVRPYLRGFGASAVASGHPLTADYASLAADVRDLADALGIKRFALVGNDWGARAAYAYAALEPQRLLALVTLATSYGALGDPQLSLEQLHVFWYQWLFQLPFAEAILTADRRAFCRYLWRVWSPQWTFAESAFDEVAPAFENAQFVALVLSYYRWRWSAGADDPALSALTATIRDVPPIRVPTTFIQGGADACNLPASSLAQADSFVAGYRRVELEGVGHFPQRERPADVAALIADAVDRGAAANAAYPA